MYNIFDKVTCGSTTLRLLMEPCIENLEHSQLTNCLKPFDRILNT